jgi:hypothetical protein
MPPGNASTNSQTERSTHSERDGYEGWRLVILLLLVGGPVLGVLWSIQFAESNPTATSPQQISDALKVTQGLSPAIQACYTVRSTISSIIISCSFGTALGVTYLFGNFIYRKFRESFVEERLKFWAGVSERLKLARPAELPEIVLGFIHYEQIILDRRNIYWRLFLRSTLALLVVSIIALLIAVCKIESQAGLPIITGIIAFVIGQGSDVLQNSAHSLPSPRVDRPLEPSGQQSSAIPSDAGSPTQSFAPSNKS